MSLQHLLASVPLATWLSLITSVAIPQLSALVTRQRGWWTGVCTALLSIASAFFAAWAASGAAFDWQLALGTAIVNWFLAAKWHSKVLAGTPVETWLHAKLGGDGVYDITSLPPRRPVTGGGAPAVGGAPPAADPQPAQPVPSLTGT